MTIETLKTVREKLIRIRDCDMCDECSNIAGTALVALAALGRTRGEIVAEASVIWQQGHPDGGLTILGVVVFGDKLDGDKIRSRLAALIDAEDRKTRESCHSISEAAAKAAEKERVQASQSIP